ncbi:MAG: hypothetical protein OXK80_06865 [Bdellovibrionales bacterium]|nr:hypothetical protein [Bdellovibrionales bacterium]
MKLYHLIVLLVIGLSQSVVLVAAPIAGKSGKNSNIVPNIGRSGSGAVRGNMNPARPQQRAQRAEESARVIPLTAGPILDARSDFEVKRTLDEAVEALQKTRECATNAEVCAVLEGIARQLEEALIKESLNSQQSLQTHSVVLNLTRGIHNIMRFEAEARDNAIFLLGEINDAKGSLTRAVNTSVEAMMIEKFKIENPTSDEVGDQLHDIAVNCV